MDRQINITSNYTLLLEDGVLECNETSEIFFLFLTSDDMGVDIVTGTTMITIINTSECVVIIVVSEVAGCAGHFGVNTRGI